MDANLKYLKQVLLTAIGLFGLLHMAAPVYAQDLNEKSIVFPVIMGYNEVPNMEPEIDKRILRKIISSTNSKNVTSIESGFTSKNKSLGNIGIEAFVGAYVPCKDYTRIDLIYSCGFTLELRAFDINTGILLSCWANENHREGAGYFPKWIDGSKMWRLLQKAELNLQKLSDERPIVWINTFKDNNIKNKNFMGKTITERIRFHLAVNGNYKVFSKNYSEYFNKNVLDSFQLQSFIKQLKNINIAFLINGTVGSNYVLCNIEKIKAEEKFEYVELKIDDFDNYSGFEQPLEIAKDIAERIILKLN